MNYVYFGFRLVNKQWGVAYYCNGSNTQKLPINFSKQILNAQAVDTGRMCLSGGVSKIDLSTIQVFGKQIDTNDYRADANLYFLVLGQ